MNDRQRRDLEVLQRVEEFCTAHPLPSPPPGYAATLDSLKSVIRDIENHAADQQSGAYSAASATRVRRSLVQTLREQHMVPLRRIATAVLPDVVGIDQKFRVPDLNSDRSSVLAAARAMVQHAPDFSSVFIDHGRPADFLPQMETMVAAVDTATDTRFTAIRRRAGATMGLKVSIAEAHKIVTFIELMVRMAFSNDKQVMLEWDRARRFEPRPAPGQGTPASPAAPSNATTGTTPAPTNGGAGGSGTPIVAPLTSAATPAASATSPEAATPDTTPATPLKLAA